MTPKSDTIEQQLAICIHNDKENAAVAAAMAYMRELESINEAISINLNTFMAEQRAKVDALNISELVKAADFGQFVLLEAKQAFFEGIGDSRHHDVMELAMDKGVGNVQRVPFDPETQDATKREYGKEAGEMIWYWGGNS